MQKSHNPFIVSALKLSWLSVLLGLLAVSCNNPDGLNLPKNATRRNELRFDIHSPLGSFHPIECTSAGANHFLPFLYSRLFIPNARGALEPDLALNWSYDDESLTWTIALRPDARFHNNQTVTSEDVVFSLEKWISSHARGLAATIDRIKAVSPTAIQIDLKKSDPHLPSKIRDLDIFPKPKKQGIDFYNHPIGSGPYRFERRQGEKTVTLKANPNYYGKAPSIKRVIFYYIPNKETSWTRLLRGDTDIAGEITLKNYDLMKHIRKKFTFHHQLHRHYSIMLFNTYDPLFADKRVRQALAHAIDRDYILENILMGFGAKANGPMGVDSPFHNPNLVPLSYNPEKSLELLRRAGWTAKTEDKLLYRDGLPFKFTLQYAEGNAIEERLAGYIKLCLAEIGIETRLEPLKFNILRYRYYQNTQFQSVITEFSGMYEDPEQIKTFWSATPPNQSGAGCFYDPQVSAIIDRALSEKNPSRQKELYYQAEALLTDLQPGLFLFHKVSVDVISNRIHLPYAFSLDYAGLCRLQYAEIVQ